MRIEGPYSNGKNGWTPVCAVVTDGARRVLQVSSWTGGQGTPPAAGNYIGATGFTSNIASAVDIRGAVGATGSAGTNGTNGSNGLDGKTVLSGSGAPGSGIGVNGDFYIANSTWMIYGPKAAGAWPPGVAIIGAQGVAGVNSFGSPTTRTLSLATAYQATNTAKPAVVTVSLTSTASLSLVTGQTHTAQIIIGSTNAVASGTGTVVGQYSNGITGTLVVGLGINNIQTIPYTFSLPVGWFFAVRQTAGTVSIVSAFDQAVG